MKSVLLGTGIYFGIKYGYRKATEFETDVYIQDKKLESGKYTIHTDKGIFLAGTQFYFKYDFPKIEFSADPVKSYNDVEKDQSYHVKAYGLNYPEYGLNRKIVLSENLSSINKIL